MFLLEKKIDLTKTAPIAQSIYHGKKHRMCDPTIGTCDHYFTQALVGVLRRNGDGVSRAVYSLPW
jgi:hypothetical protein